MAKIRDLLAAGPSCSFEFPPARTPEAAEAFDLTMRDLAPLRPTFVSITYGALGSTRDVTRDMVLRVDAEQPFPVMPHLTCVGQSRGELVDLLVTYRDAGIDNVLALAGDPPADGSESGGDFTYATELVALVREVGDFSVAVAAFPEIHPRSPDRGRDRRILADKLAVADLGITQFFFDADHYFRMVDELDALGCTTPVIPGVMPFISVAGTRRMSAMNGTAIPGPLQERLDAVDGDAEATRKLGVEVAVDLCERLVAGGVPGLHLYTMNRSASIADIVSALGAGRLGLHAPA
ncbi:MAG: methylenetetrahydrofolate reductase [Actinobacteria bacterium]|nr:methylenetetrahydrofolate reductase [Actinomycetota bacterium]